MVRQDHQEYCPSYSFEQAITLLRPLILLSMLSFRGKLLLSPAHRHPGRPPCLPSRPFAEYDFEYSCECRKYTPCPPGYLPSILTQKNHQTNYSILAPSKNRDDDDSENGERYESHLARHWGRW